MKKNIIVTGGSGFLGSHFIKKFNHNFKRIYNFDINNNKSILKYKNVKFIKQDIKKKINIKKLEKIDLIIHTIAKQPYGHNQNFKDFIKVNVDGIQNILEYSKNLNVKKIITCSSFSVYGKPLNLPVNINHSLSPTNYYGLSKLLAEKISIFYANKYNIKNIILRFDGLFGFGQNLPGFIDFAIKQIKRNKNIELFSLGKQIRDQVFIEDATKAIMKASLYKTKKNNEIFNIGGGEPKNNLEICKKIIKKTHSKSKIVLLKKKNKNFDYNFYMSLIETKKRLGYKSSKFDNILKLLKKI